jgi:glycosyltransferase involved in cell wall biosynthesis
MQRKISCTIITYNEEDRIARCLNSVHDLVDEIIVVDSGSSDRTIEICKSFGAKCFHNAWIGYGQQKRFAEDLTAHDWILNLDADEWLTDKTRAQIRSLFQDKPDDGIYGYQFKIKQVYPGANKPRLFADYHLYIRLYNKKFCRFPDSAVFDEVKIDRKNTGFISGPIFHQSILSIRHLIDKNVKYYKLQSQEINKSQSSTIPRIAVEPFTVFFKYYLLKRHFTGGAYGFIVAATIAMLRTYRLIIISSSGKAKKDLPVR